MAVERRTLTEPVERPFVRGGRVDPAHVPERLDARGGAAEVVPGSVVERCNTAIRDPGRFDQMTVLQQNGRDGRFGCGTADPDSEGLIRGAVEDDDPARAEHSLLPGPGEARPVAAPFGAEFAAHD